MNLFSRKSSAPPASPAISRAARAGPEALASNSAYGKGFYEIGAYSVALKRCENGHDLAQQLGDMLDERAQIELNYANQLRSWSGKWRNGLTKSQEYGANKKVWDHTARTGEQMADVHAGLSTSLTEGLIPKLRQWRKDHYEKTLTQYKKTREFEKDFSDAQKSWSKLIDRIAECKSEYYSACKTAKSVEEAERSASMEQRKKYADKADIARREVGFTKTKYEQAVNESRDQRARYEAAMKDVFQRTQAFEKRRFDMFRDIFSGFLKLLEATTLDNPTLRSMNDEYRDAISQHDSQQALEWWDQTYGTQTNCRWPEYEEYRD